MVMSVVVDVWWLLSGTKYKSLSAYCNSCYLCAGNVCWYTKRFSSRKLMFCELNRMEKEVREM
jgi:hypothetical protein